MSRSCNEDCPLRIKYEPASSGSQTLGRHDALDQAYVAKDLDQPIREWQTRVLVLKDGEHGSDLIADLLTIDLFPRYAVFHEAQEKTTFTALSYTWGEPKFTQNLILNGFPYSITENLYLFLQRCRQLTSIRVLWVDAVCINQHDDKEKSVQVANMINIYKYASNVVVWLGEAGDESDLAIDYLNYAKCNIVKHDRKCRNRMASTLTALRTLYERPYMSRVWIRQEVWAARSILLMCVSRSTSWENFSNGLAGIMRDLAEQAGMHDREISAAFSESVASSFARRGLNELAEEEEDTPNDVLGSPCPEIVGAINQSCHCQCTNERDRVYGIIGMTTTNVTTISEMGRDALQLRLDYSLTVAQVFVDVARYVMLREGSVSSILCLQAHFGGDGLPSWVPNWRHKTSYKPFQLLERCIRGDVRGYDTRSILDDNGLLLSNDSRLNIVYWSGPLSTFSNELKLRGCVIASLTNETATEEIISIRLAYRNKDHPNRQFKNRGELEDDLDRIIAKHLDLATQDTKARYWRELQESGMIKIDVSGKRPKKPIVLRREDVIVKQRSRLLAPVSGIQNLYRTWDRERKWDRERTWEDIKVMLRELCVEHNVPFAEVSTSRLFAHFIGKDADSARKASSKKRREAKRAAKKAAKKAEKADKAKKGSDCDWTDDDDNDLYSDKDCNDDDDDDDDDDDESDDGESDESSGDSGDEDDNDDWVLSDEEDSSSDPSTEFEDSDDKVESFAAPESDLDKWTNEDSSDDDMSDPLNWHDYYSSQKLND